MSSSSAAARCESAANTATGSSSYNGITCRSSASVMGKRTIAASTSPSTSARCWVAAETSTSTSGACGAREFQMSIHLPGVAPGTAPRRIGPSGGGTDAATSAALVFRGAGFRAGAGFPDRAGAGRRPGFPPEPVPLREPPPETMTHSVARS